jgi:SMC interacting uncharacterized protein involved in chromosome segregation
LLRQKISHARDHQERGILIDQIRRKWDEQRERISKEWQEKEAKIDECFTKISIAVCEFKATAAENQTLQKQLDALQQESDDLKQVPVSAGRQERLVRINNLRLEIQRLEEALTTADAELRAANESKNRYKRLFPESKTVVNEMLEDQKSKNRRRRQI